MKKFTFALLLMLLGSLVSCNKTPKEEVIGVDSTKVDSTKVDSASISIVKIDSISKDTLKTI